MLVRTRPYILTPFMTLGERSENWRRATIGALRLLVNSGLRIRRQKPAAKRIVALVAPS